MARDFLPYLPDQHYLLPPDMREWLPSDHLVWFISDVADTLDLSEIMRASKKSEPRGRTGYHPLPQELRRREGRLEKIRQAKAALEREAKERAECEAAEARERVQAREAKEVERGRKYGGRPPVIPDPLTATPGFSHPGSLPQTVSADSGFFSAANLADPALTAVAFYVPPERSVRKSPVAQAIRERLGSEKGRAARRVAYPGRRGAQTGATGVGPGRASSAYSSARR